MKKYTIQVTDALTGEILTATLTQEFIAGLPTQAQWDAASPPPVPASPTVTDGGATSHPDGTGGLVAQYNVQPPPFPNEPGVQYFIACDINGQRRVLSEVVNGMCEPNHLLDIYAGRSFYCIAQNPHGEAVSAIVASDNAHTYDFAL